MNEVRACKSCGTVFEREYRSSTDGRAVTTYHVFGSQSQSAALLETQHAHWTAGTCPSCGLAYESPRAEAPKATAPAPTRNAPPPAPKKSSSLKQVIWFLLKLLSTLFMLSCCIGTVQDLAWVRGATGNAVPLVAALVGYTVLFFWAYHVIWIPITPAKGEKR